MLSVAGVILSITALTLGQPASSWPQNYSGIPPGDYSPQWQTYYQVVEPLPNVTVPQSRNWAGSMSVNRPAHPNNTLFFWAFEKEEGSLTAEAGERSDEPWLIWLNGGPGASSLLGFMLENGPLHVTDTYSIVENPYSWDKLVDSIWVDQPVGTGYSTADSTGYVPDEDQMGQDFLGFLSNLVKVFPSLAERPFYLTGESYAGVYIPYITKAIFSTPNPPVKLRKFSIGDGAIGSLQVFEYLPMVTIIETYPQLINFDPDVFDYFKEQTHLCGYDLNFTYPQNGIFPSLIPNYGEDNASRKSLRKTGQFAPIKSSINTIKRALSERPSAEVEARELATRGLLTREERRQEWKRGLSGLPNGTINPTYGCDLSNEVWDYAHNYSFPWSLGGEDENVYDIPDALNPEPPANASVFLNDNRTRTAIHAPTSKDWAEQIYYDFGDYSGGNEFGDPSVEPMAFLTELATNASLNNVSMVFYSGNDDALVGHRGTEVIIQNMTFGGIQGFSQKPGTPWYDDEGNFAGIVHQERNVTYALFLGAGHEVPEYQPASSFVFLREFILGSNSTGLVIASGNGTTTVGGEDPQLAQDALPVISNYIFYGSGTTVSSTQWPSATLAAWESFIATDTATATATATPA